MKREVSHYNPNLYPNEWGDFAGQIETYLGNLEENQAREFFFRKARHGLTEARLAEIYFLMHPDKLPAGAGLEDVKLGFILHDIGSAKNWYTWWNNKTPNGDNENGNHVNDGIAVLNELEKEGIKVPQAVREIVAGHHENYNGSGYPGHIKGENIPFLGRLAKVLDVLVSICEWRKYKDKDKNQVNSLTVWQALEKMKTMKGVFDPIIQQEVEVMLVEIFGESEKDRKELPKNLKGLEWIAHSRRFLTI